MSKSKVHKRAVRHATFSPVCDVTGYYENTSMDWKRVTCKRCLAKRKDRKT